MNNLLAIVGLIVIGAINGALGFLVALGGKRSTTNMAFVALAVSIALWSFGLGVFLAAGNELVALLAAKTYYVAGILIAGTALAFADGLFYKGEYRQLKAHYLLVLLTMMAMSVVAVFPSLMIEQVVLSKTGNIVILNGLLYAIYLTFFLLYTLGAMYILFYKFRQASSNRVREQIRMVLYGYVSTGILGTIFNLIFPLLGNYQLIWVGPLFSVFLITFTFRGIVLHKLFDVRLVLARTVAYALLIGSIASIYSLVVFTFSSFLFVNSPMSLGMNVFYAILAVFLAFSFQPLKQFFDKITDRIFFKNDYKLEDAIDELGVVTSESINLHDIMAGALPLLQRSIKSEFIHIALSPQEGRVSFFSTNDQLKGLASLKELETSLKVCNQNTIVTYEIEQSYPELRRMLEHMKIDVVTRLDTAHESLGYILFGEKNGGGVYRKKDVQLISTAANELALAIQNARRFQEIRLFSKTLQTNIRKATAELQASNLKLKKLDETKDDFISMASHQLRTPLTSIKGYLSMALDGDVGELKPEQRKILEEAFASSQRMVYLIGDFLNVSRLQTGKFELETAPVHLTQLLTDEISQLRATATSRNITFVYDPPSNFPPLQLDENKIRQVMMNFIDNAIYYAKPGGGTIRVELARQTDYVTFKVIDDGIGVPVSEQRHLFTKFYRATNARRARPDGTGIGLFMAKKVVVAHGGAILFESTEGKGSMFGFRLPVKATEEATQ